jgi:CHAT domain-containing protein
MHRQFIQLFMVLALFVLQVGAAQGQTKNIAELNEALAGNQIEKADSLLQSTIKFFINVKQPDSLVNYVYLLGKINYAKSGRKSSETEIDLIIKKIKKLSSNPATLRQSYIEAGEFYGSIGLNELGYTCNEQALKYAILVPGKTGADVGIIENNLAAFAQRLGDFNLAQAHSRKALIHNLGDSNPNYEILYATYNGLGSAMWYASKPDSALHFYNLALQSLEKTPRNPINQYYRPAIILNNLAGLYQLQGQSTKAIAALKTTISNLDHFQDSDAPINKKNSTISFKFEAIDNLAGLYKDFGDLQKTRELLEFSYQQKQRNLTPDDPAIFISKILLGQLFYATRDYDKAIFFLNEGLKQMSASGTNYSFWEADACHTLAMLHDDRKQATLAKQFYEKADSLYEVSLQGEYDNIYLGFLSNTSLFYAEQDDVATAIAKALKGYNYVVGTQGLNTLLAFQQLLNLAEVYYLTDDFRKSLQFSKKAMEVLRASLNSTSILLDSVRMELKKPKAVLLKTKAEYQLRPKKDSVGLTPLYDQLNTALTILERRKSILTDAEDIELVMTEHADLVEFIKKISFELYKLTNNKKYLDRVMGLHESGLYNRIRSRLDKNDSLVFAGVPVKIQLEEKRLKSAISEALNDDVADDKKISNYLKAVDNWNLNLEKLKLEYPEYYELRYASIFKNMDHIQQTIPENTTVIRYFFIENQLLALVADNSTSHIFPLEMDSVEENIALLTVHGLDVVKTSAALYDLHRKLWLPFSKSVQHNHVIIIPDGILFNMNFEILTPQKINSFKEFATKSLLADYTISYQYSLLLLNRENKSSGIIDNFVAFAPGFLDVQKESYGSSLKDSLVMDKGYFYLLPQPFSIALATKMTKTFGGNTFLLDRSTKESFTTNAGNHKIIHIGTHAESNNDFPEFSRLIFAKNTAANDDDNSLFVDEIYNCDLRSNLTTLTACETGKPGYQEGEGMISLAHAFNYAGSESILTGLWKIDEQASSLLLETFYNNLAKGLRKDEALRQAKLTYLQNTNGRMLEPHYWAGLIIMGDTYPIQLKQKTSIWYFLIPGFVLVLVFGFFVFRGRKMGR